MGTKLVRGAEVTPSDLLGRRLLHCSISLFLLGFFLLGFWAISASASLSVQGESSGNGIFDPSIEVDPTTGTGWLTYSAVYGPAIPWGPHVETHLARTVDGGTTWTFITALNQSEPGVILLNGVSRTGFWNREVSSLVYDATDTGSEWKLMVHKIFRLDDSPFSGQLTIPSHSWLELHTAPSPTGPWQLVSRFGSGPFPPSQYPIDQAFNGLNGLLQNTLMYSEPGLIAHNGLLYMSVSALSELSPGNFGAQIVLMSSADHGASWQWVGPLLTTADATSLGYIDLGGSGIVKEGGYFFLLASPGTPLFDRLGTVIFAFSNLAEAELVLEDGIPKIFDQINLEPAPGGVIFGGQAAFHEDASAGGILMNQLETALSPEFFQIRETGRMPLPEPRFGGALAVGFACLCALRPRRLHSIGARSRRR